MARLPELYEPMAMKPARALQNGRGHLAILAQLAAAQVSAMDTPLTLGEVCRFPLRAHRCRAHSSGWGCQIVLFAWGSLATGSSCIAWGDFCTSVKRSAKPSTTGPKSPVGETGQSRMGTLSASLILSPV